MLPKRSPKLLILSQIDTAAVAWDVCFDLDQQGLSLPVDQQIGFASCMATGFICVSDNQIATNCLDWYPQLLQADGQMLLEPLTTDPTFPGGGFFLLGGRANSDGCHST